MALDFVETTEGAELFRYPGDSHLFADDSLPGCDETAVTWLMERIPAFLAREVDPKAQANRRASLLS
jgi:hypothetical protein